MLNPENIRPWSESLEDEYPQEASVIAHYRAGAYELHYLAARHTNDLDSDTMRLVQYLFEKEKFNVVLIESIPYSSGKSPTWFIEESKKGMTDSFVPGGESALAVTLADRNGIPFYAGEPDHQDIYSGLKGHNFTDQDILGFYAVRQIPQWIRAREKQSGLLERKIPPFLKHYCKIFGITQCPNLQSTLAWYRSKLGKDLTVHVHNEEVAPLSNGKLFTQVISSKIGTIRDRFTLQVIESLLHQYKKVAVIYGASHFVTLRKSFDEAFGVPQFKEDPRKSK